MKSWDKIRLENPAAPQSQSPMESYSFVEISICFALVTKQIVQKITDHGDSTFEPKFHFRRFTSSVKVLTEGYRKLQREPFVDAKRMGIVGYSRGGMAASLLAVQLDDVKAVVLGAGVYDFKKAHDEVKIEGIRQNMERETGMTKEAIRQRSSVLQMEKIGRASCR